MSNLLEIVVSALCKASAEINAQLNLSEDQCIPYDQAAMDHLGNGAIHALLNAIEDNEAAINAVDVLACEYALKRNADGEACWKAGIAALRKELDR